MGQDFNPKELIKYLIYLDANSLHSWAMSKPLPTKGFRWMTDRKSHSCILEVDLEYSKVLHDLHNEYPLSPEDLQ